MGFFFVVDFRGKFRFFSSQQSQEIQVEFSRLQRIWAAAKQKLMLLPPRILHQEQALVDRRPVEDPCEAPGNHRLEPDRISDETEIPPLDTLEGCQVERFSIIKK